MGLLQDIIDAVADDLNAEAGLAAHSTIKYRRPRVILPEDCPLLIVWHLNDQPSPQTTSRFDTAFRVGISWHEQAVQEAQTLVQDDALSLALIAALEKIQIRLREISREGLPTVPNAYEILPGETQYLAEEFMQGLTEGYRTELLLAAFQS